MSHSTLITKARNIIVELKLRSDNTRLVGKIIDFDETFIEVIVMVSEQDGTFATKRQAFEAGSQGWREDRVLINLSDISIIS